MLTNSFSYLPIKADGKWMLVSDQSVVAYLRGASNAERNRRLGATIESAVTSSSLRLDAAPLSSVDAPVEEVKANITQLPVLVVDSMQNLLGILTAFDLL